MSEVRDTPGEMTKTTPGVMTKLERFMRSHGITPAALAKEAHVSRQQLYRLRMGTADCRIFTAMRIADACGRLIFRYTNVDDVFGR